MKAILFALFLLVSSATYAACPLTLGVSTNGGTAAQRAAVQTSLDRVLADACKDLPNADVSTYLDGMSNANVVASKGIGVDYASEIDLFVVGAGAGVGADLGDGSISDIDAEKVRGFGLATALMAGVNLSMFKLPQVGFIDFNKMKLFVNYMSMSQKFADDKMDFDSTTLGFHLQYNLVEGIDVVPGYMLRWTGVDITAGYEMNSMELKYTHTENKTGSYTDSGVTTNYNLSGNAVIAVDSSTHSIPVEVSTGVRLLYLLSLYGGLGADFNFGESTATVTDSITGTATPSVGGVTATLDPSINVGQKGEPKSMMGRAFIGTMFNFWLVKINIHVNKGLGNDTFGANVGMRVAW